MFFRSTLLKILILSFLTSLINEGICGVKNYESYDAKIYESIAVQLKGFVEMSKTEQLFLNGLIRKHKPKKILEVGVAKGGSSAIILNAIKDIEGAKLYSIDKATKCYSKKGKKTGFIVKERFSQLANKWELYTGGIVCDFIEKVGKDIEFVFIDTVHVTPGEMLDLIQILPYLKKSAIIVLHDTALHLTDWGNWKGEKQKLNFSNNLIFSYLKGKQIVPSSEEGRVFYNIGAVKLDPNQEKNYYGYFYPLSFHWEYLPQEADLQKIRSFIEKHYDIRLLKMYDEAVRVNKEFLENRGINPGVKDMDRRYNEEE